jgi:glucosamine--fructose-6-phosphate aminotransferase (isomerizing)
VGLTWLGDQLISACPAHFPLLESAPQKIQDYLEGWQAHTTQMKALLAGAKNLFLVGRGDSLAAAGTGGLIVKEAAHFPAEGMSSASFRHGPIEMLSPQVFVLVFQGNSQVAYLNHKLAQDIRLSGGQSGLVQEGAAVDGFHIPASPSPLRPLLEILPVEMITLALAELQGREAGRFERGSKVTLVE